MRECWFNVYPETTDPHGGPGPFIAGPALSAEHANLNACDVAAPGPGELRARGVGYRLHVRLKPSRLDGLEDLAQQMMTSLDPAARERGRTRLKMIEAARAKGVV